MHYKQAECLIFTPKCEDFSGAIKKTKNTPCAEDCVRGYVLLPAAFLDQHEKIARLFEQSSLRVVRNEDTPCLPPSDHRLDVYEILLDENPSTSVDPLSVGSDHSDTSFIVPLICNTTVKISNDVYNPSDIRPAVDGTNLNAFQHLVARNFELPRRDSGGILHLATSRRQEVLMRTVLDNGAEINNKTERGATALHLAIVGDSIPWKQYILNAVAKDNLEGTPTHNNCPKNLKLVQLLLARGADVNVKAAVGKTPLHKAAAVEDPELVLMLLKKGAVVDAKNCRGKTPLHFTQKPEVQELLLENGADANIYDSDFSSPIIRAIQFGGADSVKILLDYGARVEMWYNDRLILTYAMTGSRQSLENIKILLEYSFITPRSLMHQLESLYRPWGDDKTDSDDSDDFYLRYIMIDRQGVVAAHAVKIMALHNLTNVRRIKLERVWNNDEGSIAEFRRKCDAEVALLKQQKLSDTNLSWWDVLTKDVYYVYRLLKNPSICGAIDPDVLKRQFPIYGDILNLHFRKGKHRRWLQWEGIKSFKLLSRGFRRLPDEIIEEIVSLLSTVDILNLRRAIAARTMTF